MPENNIPEPKKKGFFKRLFKWPNISFDLNRKKDRQRFLFVNLALLVLVGLFSFAGLEAFHYSESSEFCGTTCHTMEPQHVRYEQSEHAKVECVDCHVGEGLEYFIEAKWSGMRQVYQMVTNSYPTPITGPVHNLRPASETCQTCHTPTSFKHNIVRNIVHYDNDYDNTKVQSNLIVKLGGYQNDTSDALGIHWHVSNNVYYIAADRERQVMLWVGVEQEDGTLKEFYSRDAVAMAQSNFVEEAYENDEVRKMDCIDCHNRAAHYIPTPQESVDGAIQVGLISQDIPYIRANAIDVISAGYDTTEDAHVAIENLLAYYTENSLSYDAEDLDEALEIIKDIYDETAFPEMNSDWLTSPNNVRHTASPGCFRCHDGNHVVKDATGEAEGDVISVKCNLCHTVPIVGRGEDLLIEAPVIVGEVPDTHIDFRWTIEHRDISEADKKECLECHGNGFCNNGICHNLSHPEDMLFTHPEEYKEQGGQVCYNCHQDITCTRCHPGGIIENP